MKGYEDYIKALDAAVFGDTAERLPPLGPIPVLVRRFQCPSCRRTFSKRKRAENYMATCPSDPKRRACKTCRHLIPQQQEWDASCAVGRPLVTESVEGPWGLDGGAFTLHMNCPLWEAK